MAGEGVWLRRSGLVATDSPAVVRCCTLPWRRGLRIAPAGRAPVVSDGVAVDYKTS